MASRVSQEQGQGTSRLYPVAEKKQFYGSAWSLQLLSPTSIPPVLVEGANPGPASATPAGTHDRGRQNQSRFLRRAGHLILTSCRLWFRQRSSRQRRAVSVLRKQPRKRLRWNVQMEAESDDHGPVRKQPHLVFVQRAFCRREFHFRARRGTPSRPPRKRFFYASLVARPPLAPLATGQTWGWRVPAGCRNPLRGRGLEPTVGCSWLQPKSQALRKT